MQAVAESVTGAANQRHSTAKDAKGAKEGKAKTFTAEDAAFAEMRGEMRKMNWKSRSVSGSVWTSLARFFKRPKAILSTSIMKQV
jgi:hypothetical protein